MTRTLVERNDSLNRKMNNRAAFESSYSAPIAADAHEAVCDMADINLRREGRAHASVASFALPLAAVFTCLSGLFVR
ncbi:MAG: hypothetical protein IIW34_05155 [Clostridia bacterium]|nr:hypothetical protein [Clostridia bacterium]MBQ2326000.1 hypothetical protein [Clostridia bacterium]MBQ5813518.1 hypothetical protein [Clostridia bacterium]